MGVVRIGERLPNDGLAVLIWIIMPFDDDGECVEDDGEGVDEEDDEEEEEGVRLWEWIGLPTMSKACGWVWVCSCDWEGGHAIDKED